MKNNNLLVIILLLLPVEPVIAQSSLPPSGSLGNGSSVDRTAVPEGLMPGDWSRIHAVYEAGRHKFHRSEQGHTARNHGNAWLAHFDGRGFNVGPHQGDWSFGLELARYGFEGVLCDVEEASEVCADEQRLTYDWNSGLSEWWVNDTRGLEHGFTVHQRPQVAVENVMGPLVFDLSVRGGLRPVLMASERGLRFVDAQGSTALVYDGLVAFDADGVKLEAWLEVRDEGVRIAVLEESARYPLTVDPVMQTAYLKASNTDISDQFGTSVAVFGDTVVVGARGERSNAAGVNGDQADNTAFAFGAAYVFVRSGSTWTQQAYLKASNPEGSDSFGYSVAGFGDTVVVGALGEDSSATGVNGNQFDSSADDSGAAYVFVRVGSTWSQQAYLKASNTDEDDSFGSSVAVFEDTVVVGALQEGSSGTGVNGSQSDNSASWAGAAYVFVRTGNTWSQQAYLKASNTDEGDNFGDSVSIHGNTLVVGASREDSSGNQPNNSRSNSGAAYVFVRSGSTWSQQAYLKASNPGVSDWFGGALSVSEDTLVVGARQEDSNATGVNGNDINNSAGASGAAYVYVRTGNTWSQQAYLKASNTEAADAFGFSVSISGNTLVVGARAEDSASTVVDGNQADNSIVNSGAAYVFTRAGSTWGQQAYLKPSNPGVNDFFGESISISEDTVIVGAPREDSSATGVNGNQMDNAAGQSSGAGYIYDLAAPRTIGSNICDPAVPNSTGVPAELNVAGSASVGLNVLSLQATSLPPNIIGLFLTSQAQGLIQNPGGSQGTLCLSGSIGRFNGVGQIMNSGPNGAYALPVDLTQIPQPAGLTNVLAGQTWFFQSWFRDTQAGQLTSNFTNGVEVTFN